MLANEEENKDSSYSSEKTEHSLILDAAMALIGTTSLIISIGLSVSVTYHALNYLYPPDHHD